jgi:hypothetical protein
MPKAESNEQRREQRAERFKRRLEAKRQERKISIIHEAAKALNKKALPKADRFVYDQTVDSNSEGD